MTFEKVRDNKIFIRRNSKQPNFDNIVVLNKYGCTTNYNDEKCRIFPKGKTTWEGFQRPFKDGDIVTWEDRGSLVAFIYKERKDVAVVKHHFALYTGSLGTVTDGEISLVENEIVFATEEEKQKLFQAIKDNGYKWNAETKTLEKLIEPRFITGDTIKNKNDKWQAERTIQSYVAGIGYSTTIHDWIRLEDQDNWELVIKPIFKVGNKIKDTRNNSKGTILKITDEGYECQFEFGNFIVSFKDQNNWKLVPKFKKGDNVKHKESGIYCTIGDYAEGLKGYHTNIGHCISDNDVDNWELVSDKFDINTLVPFESKVLIRNAENQRWIPAFWGCRCKDGYITTFGWCKYCIPFEYNSDLMNSTLDCSNYFKTWE